MSKKPVAKSPLSPRSAKPVGSKPAAKGHTAPAKAPTKRTGPTKADQMVAMLSRPKGASMAQLQAKLGTLAHTIRAAISIEKRRRGPVVELADGRYRIM